MVNDPLFAPLKAGALDLPNRIVMAPMTRNRADGDGIPGDLVAAYYRQRAGAGLIITEATQVSPDGQGYINTPGIHTEAQVAAWRRVTDAVHAAGGRIALQLWHVGRISHTSLQPGGRAPVAPSAIRANTQTVTAAGFVDVSEPRALETHEIPGVVEAFATGARNAIRAGFDAVEIHGANGYLIDQFIRDGSNRRTDAYGGPAENRVRFLREVTEAVAGAVGADRVGVRLSPFNGFNDMSDSDPEATFGAAIRAIDGLGLAYLHLVERSAPTVDPEQAEALARLRALWHGVYIANGAYDPQSAVVAVRSRAADAIAFGTLFIGNPDLVERLRRGAPLAGSDKATYYGGAAAGYTDYPTLDAAA
jgi:N-ethylmaleimide reductase